MGAVMGVAMATAGTAAMRAVATASRATSATARVEDTARARIRARGKAKTTARIEQLSRNVLHPVASLRWLLLRPIDFCMLALINCPDLLRCTSLDHIDKAVLHNSVSHVWGSPCGMQKIFFMYVGTI